MDFHLTSSNLLIINQKIKELLDQGYIVTIEKKKNLSQNAKYNSLVRSLAEYTGYGFLEMKDILKRDYGFQDKYGTTETKGLSSKDMGDFLMYIQQKADYFNLKY